jgi:tetratricopeptide (TPR) repeat protein
MDPMRSLCLALLFAVALPGGQARSPQDWAQAGWEAIKAGRGTDAAAAFEAALKLTPQEPQLLVGAGVAANMLGRTDDARRFLIDALRKNPALTPASVLLGEVLYRATDLPGAIAVYEQALAHAPEDAHLVSRLDAWRTEAALHNRFGRRYGNHFTVLFEGPAEAELAERAVAILEDAYLRIGTALYTYPADVVTVVLYTREQFRDVTQSPDWAGGAFDGRIRVPVMGALQNPGEFERVLAHEFTHALVRSVAPTGVPFWFNEGLAVVFESGDVAEETAIVRDAAALLPLARLERSFAGLDAKQATLAYAQSAVAVQSLIERAGGSAIASVLTDLGRSVPFAQAFERHFLLPYSEFQKK